MQVRFFTIPIHEPESAEEEMNRFLRGHRVLEVVDRFIEDGGNSRWCFLVKYLDGHGKAGSGRDRADRVDYRDVLDEAAFARFCLLRKARKMVAEEEGVPAFALFTDKQMAQLAAFASFSPEVMKQVDGIGEGKAERYGDALMRALGTLEMPDKSGEADAADGQSV